MSLFGSDDSGHPRQVEDISIRLNRKQAVDGSYSDRVFLNRGGNVPWVLPKDESVDLAVFPILPDEGKYDFKMLSSNIFATSEFLSQHGITVGEPVFFTGFFYQFPGTKRIQPIMRQGILAMMPGEKFPLAGTPENLYLTDVHAFGGNSGSPMFINLGGYHHGALVGAEDYRLVGVLNGGVLEDEHFNLELSTSVTGVGAANSGVSTIVPTDELRTLLEDHG